MGSRFLERLKVQVFPTSLAKSRGGVKAIAMSILDQIVANKIREVSNSKATKNISALRQMAEVAPPSRDFLGALIPFSDSGVKVIAECKKASPSRGIICEDYDPASLAKAYEQGGAAAISVLTDEQFFKGSLQDLKDVVECTTIPILRKDFVVDEYQVIEARAHLADSFLLIASCLDFAKLQYFIEVGRDFGMEPLVETHSRDDMEKALATDAKIIGINNRHLESMTISPSPSLDVLELFQKNGDGRLLICESGIRDHQDVRRFQELDFRIFLVGSSLAGHKSPREKLKELLYGELDS